MDIEKLGTNVDLDDMVCCVQELGRYLNGRGPWVGSKVKFCRNRACPDNNFFSPAVNGFLSYLPLNLSEFYAHYVICDKLVKRTTFNSSVIIYFFNSSFLN